MDHDLIVIGGGAGGLAAARAARRRGATTLLVQHGPLGGDCTFTGCVPSKTLIATAARGSSFADAMHAVGAAVATIARAEDDDVLAREGVDVVHGWATFRDPRTLDIDGHVARTRRFVIATGARPTVPPIDGLDQVDYLTNETVFDLHQLPASLVVLGGGAIGCELAQAFARLGSTVTIVEALDRILAREEPETSTVITDALQADGVDVRVGQAVTRVEPLAQKGAATLHLADGTRIAADRVLVAVGKAGSVSSLGLERAGVETANGFIVTDDHLATTAREIWAVGDVAGRLQLTHAADEMGRVAVANALGRRRRRFDTRAIPWAVFTSPEVGRVGITEARRPTGAAASPTFRSPSSTAPSSPGTSAASSSSSPAPADSPATPGGGILLGATTVAPVGGELVHEATLAMRTNMFTGRLAQTVHAYPTWSVAIRQAAAQFLMDVGGREARPATKHD